MHNIHASAVVLGDRGVLITGESGSGKTGLALALVARMQASGQFARLVGDDQLFLHAHGSRLVCSVPGSIAGLAEARGAGPRPVDFEPRAVVDLLVRLVPRQEAPRPAEPGTERLAGCVLACLTLAAGDREAAVLAVASCLALPPFRPGVA